MNVRGSCFGSARLWCIFATLVGCGANDDAAPKVADAGAARDAADVPDPAPKDAGPPGPECDPRAPRCAEGERCTANHTDLAAPWPAPRCTPIVGEGALQEGEACISSPGRYDFCDEDLACTNFGTGEGFCVAQCSAAGQTCTQKGYACALVDPSTGFRLCLQACEKDADCDAPGWLKCVDREGARVCDAAMSPD